MELDLQSLFGLHVHSCTVLIGWNPPPPQLGSYTRALLVSQDRRHLFVTPCVLSTVLDEDFPDHLPSFDNYLSDKVKYLAIFVVQHIYNLILSLYTYSYAASLIHPSFL